MLCVTALHSKSTQGMKNVSAVSVKDFWLLWIKKADKQRLKNAEMNWLFHQINCESSFNTNTVLRNVNQSVRKVDWISYFNK